MTVLGLTFQAPLSLRISVSAAISWPPRIHRSREVGALQDGGQGLAKLVPGGVLRVEGLRA